MTLRRDISKEVRTLIFSRDNYKCRFCGCGREDNIKLTVDHFFPISKGGTNDLDNLWTLCQECNKGKRDMILKKPTKEISSVGIPVPQEYSIEQVTQALQHYKKSTNQEQLTIYQAIIVVQTPGLTDGINPLFYPLPAQAIVNAIHSLEKQGKLKIEKAMLDVSNL